MNTISILIVAVITAVVFFYLGIQTVSKKYKKKYRKFYKDKLMMEKVGLFTRQQSFLNMSAHKIIDLMFNLFQNHKKHPTHSNYLTAMLCLDIINFYKNLPQTSPEEIQHWNHIKETLYYKYLMIPHQDLDDHDGE